VAGWLGGQEVLTGRILTLEDVNALVDGVTTSDIKVLSSKLMDRARMRLAVVGPVQKTEPLRKLIEG
jgi:predicted Zn-dependent peptidase